MKTETNQNTNQGHEANTLLAVSGPIEARIKYLAQTEREELDMLDNVAVGSLERQAKWMLIRELGARKSEAEFLLKEIQAACASGAVDKTVSDGHNLEEPKFYNSQYRPGDEKYGG